ncbi:MAG: 3-phosphoserine/phosphohydroxythreonine transaminase [Candidatus Hydrogenedentes bacterium]|nr:3-phosphoserine/phosphohydroxythreonine transaminase [Candidatus Hydrogenedentota bacterium]
MEQRVYNFSAGPATLPVPALEEAQRNLLCLPGAGASVMEISHRSKQFEAVLQAAKGNIGSLLDIPEGYKIVFMQGGATLQFALIAMNFLPKGQQADYVNMGSWAKKAISEAKKVGSPRVIWDGASENYTRMPRRDELTVNADAAYIHTTSNETIQGIELQSDLDFGDVPQICDMSSDFLSRPVDVSKYGMIYAGAQKNVGPAGVVICIIREDLLARVPEGLPSLLDYKQIAENDSLLNTPPSFSVYMVELVTRWVKETIGGLDKMAELNREKASLLYQLIDEGDYYRGHSQPECRSVMNVTFRLPSEDLEKKFISEATKAGLDGLKGHRSVGGCRASIYNAMPREGVVALRDFMIEFRKNNG